MTIRRKILISLVTVLVIAAIADLSLLTKRAYAQSERAKYFKHTYSRPFTVESIVTLTGESTPKVLHNLDTVSVNSHGDLLRSTKKFDSPTATIPYATIHRLAEAPDGAFYVTFVAGQDSQIYGLQGKDRRFLRDHPLPENQCTTSDPGIGFVRGDTISIGGASHSVYVVGYTSKQPPIDATYFLSAEADCVELRSVVNYVDPNGKHGVTIREPIAFTLGEPDAELSASVKNAQGLAIQSPTPEAFEAKVIQLQRSH